MRLREILCVNDIARRPRLLLSCRTQHALELTRVRVTVAAANEQAQLITGYVQTDLFPDGQDQFSEHGSERACNSKLRNPVLSDAQILAHDESHPDLVLSDEHAPTLSRLACQHVICACIKGPPGN